VARYADELAEHSPFRRATPSEGAS
jgi:hypothetical protein